MDRATHDQDVIHDIEMMTCSQYSHLCIGMPSNDTGDLAMYTDNKEMHARDRLSLWPAFHGDRLAERGSRFTDEGYDFVIHHQVGNRFVDLMNTVGKRSFEAPMPQSLSILDKFANTATTSHYLVLHQALAERRIPRGSKLLMVPAASGGDRLPVRDRLLPGRHGPHHGGAGRRLLRPRGNVPPVQAPRGS
ncbi:3-oxoacyl-[acyl-carrier-protein] synthase III C-terminal domain-containing protein [Streptomyces sp. NPDC008343]|uniref:3-oxoacyl-[acyl-carrier-protein] synthase III C-terminal domain-containing protein n=1 Tax=Streptomyces sp. NPDC008343 TaxID=3364828 RepID=UPI0036E8B3C3